MSQNFTLPALALDPQSPVLARDAVYSVLRRAILDGSLPRGERLVERELAQKLGISRTPVREALQRLEVEGLAEKYPRRGLVVSGMSRQDILDIYEIRAALEGLVTAMAARRRTPADVERLDRLLAEMDRCCLRSPPDLDEYRRLHNEFNDTIYRVANSPRLHEMLQTLRTYVEQFSAVNYERPGWIEEAHQEHQLIVAAIRVGDPEAAEAAARRHIRRSRDVYLAALGAAENGRG
ncbi:GntR family transcriptional regulator [Caldinitratiruptor microaerophilus]|uniref:GntR family transcriptional regulator n=1 Tax=Caldinitratiruptor microaerophilus TaxID=671077 RepID=A0AA35CP28_9FIRM|nr:GntR family transcriptional regulator [Caldinitratiruptor microaerophilus]BDG60985.1 GntR family transcriptional regulator [Caldinitratiruptor microaerophilus]